MSLSWGFFLGHPFSRFLGLLDRGFFFINGSKNKHTGPSPPGLHKHAHIHNINSNPPYEHEDEKYQQVASDCIWSDPASEEQELTTVDPNTGYGQSLRGGGAICFGHKAVTQFLEQVDCSYIMRAHEAHAEGVAVSKGARVFTVFSTSQDHNQGSHAMAGCILVDNDKLQVINRSPAYKNQYIHRRDSVSLAHVSELEIQKRIRLGLVKDDNNSSSSHVVTTQQHEQYEEETNHANDQDNDEVDDDDEVLDMEETWQDLDDTSSDAEVGVDLDDEDVVVDDEDDEAHPRPSRRQSRGETSGVILEVGMDGSDCGGGDYVIDKTRRSSVDLTTLNLPPASILEQQQPPESDSQKVARISGSSNNNSSGFVFEQQQPQQQHSIGFEWMRGGTNHGGGGGGGVLLGSGVLGNGMANNNNNHNRNSNHRTSFFFSSGQQHLQSLLPPQQPQRQSSLSSAFGPIDENNAQGGDNDGGGIVGNDGSIINDDNDQQQQQQIGPGMVLVAPSQQE